MHYSMIRRVAVVLICGDVCAWGWRAVLRKTMTHVWPFRRQSFFQMRQKPLTSLVRHTTRPGWIKRGTVWHFFNTASCVCFRKISWCIRGTRLILSSAFWHKRIKLYHLWRAINRIQNTWKLSNNEHCKMWHSQSITEALTCGKQTHENLYNNVLSMELAT